VKLFELGEMLLDDVAADGDEVELGTEEEQMMARAAAAFHSFELVDDVLRFIFEVAIVFVVLWVLSEFVEQLFVADFVDHGVTDGFDFEVAPALGDEVEAYQKGLSAFVNFDCVGDEAIAAVLQFLSRVADFANLQNAHFEERIALFDYFVGRVNLPFHFVGDVKDGTLQQFSEEGESAEQIEVALAVYFLA